MNHAIVIARNELRGRARLFLLAAAFAVIPFLASLMPGVSGSHRPDVIAIGGAVLGLSLGLGTAIALGSSVIARELSERRLSFYFAKPISPAALWIGKAAAALATSLACLFIIVTPAFLVVKNTWTTGIAGIRAILFVGVVGVVVLFFVSHALFTVVRSRSALVALDLTLAAAAGAALYFILRSVALSGAFEHGAVIVIIALVAILIALAVAPVLQLANGRTDARRSHAAFSRAIWPAVAAIVVIAGVYSAWLISPDPEDIAQVYSVEQAPSGNWTMLSGATRYRFDYPASFVVNSATGESVRLHAPLWWGANFSRDGRSMAWMEAEGQRFPRYGHFHVRVRDLDEGKTYNTGIRVTEDEFVLSDDGSRLAVADDKVLIVREVASGKMLASAKLNPDAAHRMFFVSPNVVRVIELHRNAGSIFELDVAARSFRQTGRIPDGVNPFFSASGDGSRALGHRNTVVDGRTGAVLITLPEWNGATQVRPRMLSDGRIARTGLVGGVIHVQTFSVDGVLEHDVVLPGMQHAFVSGDSANGKLIVAASRTLEKKSNMHVIDLATGTIERVLDRTHGPMPSWSADPRRAAYPANMSFIATDAKGELIVWKNERRAEARPLFKSR